MAQTAKVLLVGLSGPSSSGKTTLARLLRQILPLSFIIHEDDFYWPDDRIPVKNGVQDWDCLEALDLDRLQSSLRYIKQHGAPPPDLVSKEDQNSTGPVDVNEDVISELSKVFRKLFPEQQQSHIALIDGFLLYSQEMKAIRDLFDVKLLLWSDYESTRSRREKRSGYVTIEGFWQDPPGYVDNYVWPNYIHDHAYLFQDGNVEGEYDYPACELAGIEPIPHDKAANMTESLKWASHKIFDTLIRQQGSS